ncbi:MAG: hypothetical protein V8Q55_03220 [Christensenellales bacterium]
MARDTVPPFAIFNACSAPDYLFVSNTLRSSFSSFSAFAVCSLASHLFASKKSSVQDVQPSTTSVVLFSLSGYACVAHVLRVRSAPCPRLPRLVRLAPRLVNVWQEITTPLRMLAFRDFQRLLCARLSLCFKHAPRLVLVFLGSCRLLFGKTPLCKQKSSVQDVQPSTTSVVLFHRQTAGEVLTYFVYAPRLVLVFLGSCRLLFGKSPLCKQKSSVQDVQQKHGDLPCFLI